MQAYMAKAVKEAKQHSSWINPNEEYENATTLFVERVLAGPGTPGFLSAFVPFQQRVARAGLVNSLSQVILKTASPGVPDFYQGSELWDLNLVDPDNRRPVDFRARACALDRIDALLAQPPAGRAAGFADLLKHWHDGAIKLLVTAVALRTRRDRPDLFLDGEYLPLETDIPVDGRVVAFARMLPGTAAIAIAPHLVARMITPDRPVPLGEMWKTARVLLPPSLAAVTWTDALSGATLHPVRNNESAWLFVGQALKMLPVALLVAP